MTEPKIEHERDPRCPMIVDSTTGRDDRGDTWTVVIANPHAEILAGRDDLGNFHCFVTTEELFDAAAEFIHHLLLNQHTDTNGLST